MLTSARPTPMVPMLVGAGFVIAGFLLLVVASEFAYVSAVTLAAIVAVALAASAPWPSRTLAWIRVHADLGDLTAIAIVYVLVVAGFRLAFVVIGTANPLGLFGAFGASLIVGVVAPVVYTVWIRHRRLASLGLQVGDWRLTAALALVFAGVQCAITLPQVTFPTLDVWLPLLVMALVVGAFEALFFRGFVQLRLEQSFGLIPAVAGASILYGVYHIGYGMGPSELAFLAALGVVYAVAFRLAGSLLVLWPLLTPVGSLFSQLQGREFELPFISILGFADVLGVMVFALWFARRHQKELHP